MTTEVQKKEEELREELAAVLAREDIDYDRVVELSTELAKQDPDNVRFSTDAAIISRLGQELVSKQETAVSELIKNAYDADATKAHLIFYDADEPGGTLEILDDGNGMTREQLISGFMRISSLDKVENPISPRYNRSRAGKKGIGRFAAQRLGQELEIRTQTRDADYALRVLIDWSEFVGGRDLSTIASEIDEVPKKQEHGTTLTIRNLREAWTEETIKRLYRYTSEITQPFPLSEQHEQDDRDPGFKARLYQEEEGDLELVADEETEVYEHSLATIEGEVDNEGRAVWSLTSERLDFTEEDLIMEPEGGKDRFQEIKEVNFEIHYFIYKKELVPHGYLTTLRELGREKGGVRVYRNGFRVLPYGESGDDWLRLDEEYRRRRILPPITTDHFFGFVEIEDRWGEKFEEKSSREGLIENDAFRELRSCLRLILIDAVQTIARVRGRKQKADQRDWEEDNQDSTERLKSAAKEISEIASEEGKKDESEDFDKDEGGESKRLEEAESQLHQAVEEIVEEVGMLRVLASLGLSIGEFTHEIKNSIGDVTADANFLADVLDEETMEGERAERLHRSLKGFDAYSGYFDQAVKQNVTRELEIQPLDRVARRFVRRAQEGAEKYGIEIHDPEINGIDLYTCEMHPSEWPAILFNFYTNARKAVERADVQQGRIFIRVGREEDRIYLEFQDNGIGIPEENEERIFDAFFTTMPPKGVDAPEEEVLQGSGLGLKIVNDMVSSYQGEVFVDEPDEEFSTCLRVELPSASKDQIEEYEERYG